jgi:hypothetical protein
MSAVTEALAQMLPEIYYAHTMGKYWCLESRGRWFSINEDNV